MKQFCGVVVNAAVNAAVRTTSWAHMSHVLPHLSLLQFPATLYYLPSTLQ